MQLSDLIAALSDSLVEHGDRPVVVLVEADEHAILHVYADDDARLAARLTHIGQDHAIRRALGWEVEPGTLAQIWRDEDSERWVFGLPGLPGQPDPYWLYWLPADNDAEDDTEALAAIYAEVCNG